MDRLKALRIFCTLAEKLHFKETADHLAVSPQVISRTIAQLEKELGETLFQRNTRQVQLSDFGANFLPNAKELLQQSERLFQQAEKIQSMHGTVRLTVPDAPIMHQLLPALLTALKPYPKLHLDWRMDMKITDKIAERIDIGIRMGSPPIENSLIVKKVAQFHEKIVASPALLAHYGMPKNLEDLRENYPLVGFINQSEKIWTWEINEENYLQAPHYHFISNNLQSHLQAALIGHSVAYLHHSACLPYLKTGQLQELFPELPKKQWGVYLYRPYYKVVPARIALVFKLLEQEIKKQLPN